MMTSNSATDVFDNSDTAFDHFDSPSTQPVGGGDLTAASISASFAQQQQQQRPLAETNKYNGTNLPERPQAMKSSTVPAEPENGRVGEAGAWSASQQFLVHRVQALEAELLAARSSAREEILRAEAAQASLEEAETSLGRSTAESEREHARLAGENAQLRAELAAGQASQQAQQPLARDEDALLFELQERLMAVQAENARLQAELEDRRAEAASQLEGRAEHAGQLRDATRELARQNKALQSRVAALQTALDQQTEKSAAAAAKRGGGVRREQPAAGSEQQLTAARNTALSRIAELLSAQLGVSAEGAAADPEGAIVLAERVRQRSAETHNELAATQEALQSAVSQVADLEAQLTAALERCAALEGDATAARDGLRAAREALHGAEAQEARAEAVEAALTSCRDELAAEAAQAAASALEASQLRSEVVAAEQRASAAAAEAGALRGSAEARDQRALEMRGAAAAAIELAGDLRSSLHDACSAAGERFKEAERVLLFSAASPETEAGPGAAAALTGAISACISRLESAAQLSPRLDHTAALANAMKEALADAAGGFEAVAAMVQEHSRVRAALSRITAADAIEISAASETAGAESLEELLGCLLDRFEGLTEAVSFEKRNLEKQVVVLQTERDELFQQSQSLESVLRTAVLADSDAGEALVQLAAARRRIGELEEACAAMEERMQQAQQAQHDATTTAARDWSGVRADVAQLVQHVERAQVDAESAMRHVRSKAAQEVNAARAKEHAAAAARSAAERDAATAREEAAGLARELQAATTAAEAWQHKAVAAEEALQRAQRRLGAAETAAAATLVASSSAEGESEKVTRLRVRLSQLEAKIADLQHNAAATGAKLVEALQKVETAEEAAARQSSESEAAAAREEGLVAEVAEAKAKSVELELELLQLKTHLEAIAAASPLEGGALPAHSSADLLPAAQPARSEHMPSRVAASLSDAQRRRLEGAERQVETLRALNRNLEQQLAAATGFTRAQRGTSGSTAGPPIVGALATAHAMIDALQSQMTADDEPPSSSSAQQRNQQPGESRDPLQRVVSLWRDAFCARDRKLEEAQRELQDVRRELAAKKGELAAAQQAAKALCRVREEAVGAAYELESKLRQCEEERRSLHVDSAAAEAAREETASLRGSLQAAEARVAAAMESEEAAAARAGRLERQLRRERERVADVAEQQRAAQAAEARAAAAEAQAAEAEAALARQLEAAAEPCSETLGRQLEASWAAEKALAGRVEECRRDVTAARAEADAARREAEIQALRAEALNAQLQEVLGALEEQGAVVEALQAHLCKDRGQQ